MRATAWVGRQGARGLRQSLWTLLAVALAVAAPAHAQTLRGRILDDTNQQPVGGAVVTLMDRSGVERVKTLTDPVGRFAIEPPAPGEYYVRATGLGYGPARSPLLSLGLDGSATLDMLLQPRPIGAAGFEVTVEARAHEHLRQFGLLAADLGDRWVDRRGIEAVAVKRDVGSVLEARRVGDAYVFRSGGPGPASGDVGLCVRLARARTSAVSVRCALIVWNGVPIPGALAIEIDPESVESMAVLTSVEASVFYGNLSSGGALLVWSRRGR